MVSLCPTGAFWPYCATAEPAAWGNSQPKRCCRNQPAPTPLVDSTRRGGCNDSSRPMTVGARSCRLRPPASAWPTAWSSKPPTQPTDSSPTSTLGSATSSGTTPPPSSTPSRPRGARNRPDHPDRNRLWLTTAVTLANRWPPPQSATPVRTSRPSTSSSTIVRQRRPPMAAPGCGGRVVNRASLTSCGPMRATRSYGRLSWMSTWSCSPAEGRRQP